MKKAMEKDNQIIVSTLNILEIVEVIRKRITEKEYFVGLNQTAKSEIKNKIDQKTKDFMKIIMELSAQNKLMLTNPAKSVNEYFEDTFRLFAAYFGNVDKSDFCFICNHNIPDRYRYVGMGHYDLQHALNAKECMADEIATFDKGFSQLNSIGEFSSLKVTVL